MTNTRTRVAITVVATAIIFGINPVSVGAAAPARGISGQVNSAVRASEAIHHGAAVSQGYVIRAMAIGSSIKSEIVDYVGPVGGVGVGIITRDRASIDQQIAAINQIKGRITERGEIAPRETLADPVAFSRGQIAVLNPGGITRKVDAASIRSGRIIITDVVSLTYAMRASQVVRIASYNASAPIGEEHHARLEAKTSLSDGTGNDTTKTGTYETGASG